MRYKESLLDHNFVKEILFYDPETGLFTWKIRRGHIRKGCIAGSISTSGYITIKIDRVQFFGHRLAWFYMTGKWPDNQIDHEDLNKSNNKWSNLREATGTTNNFNKALAKNNKLGFKGLYFDKRYNKFRAVININKKCIFLGHFTNKDDAASAYNEAAKKYHGEFYRSGSGY
jgi:hypothetical protein